MLSFVVGQQVGIARKANPIVVRIAQEKNKNSERGRDIWTPQIWADYLSKINDDLGRTTSTEAKCVVLLALYYPQNVVPAGWEDRVYALLTSIVSKGGIIVTGSGNMKSGEAVVDGWPVNFGKNNVANNIPSLIVVGAILGNGGPTNFAIDELAGVPHVYAPVSQVALRFRHSALN
jgi:hypothetical protein